MLREQQRILSEVEMTLPSGDTVTFPLHGQRLDDRGAACYVVKDAGDDPDVTNGAEIHARIEVTFFTEHRIVLQGGEGIGRVTKPGLAVEVGEWAINPVPRRMILEGVKEVLAMRCMPATFTITISIPDGVERARRTLNERLGIVGGLSILGTTGIVRPISAQAWTDTIDTALDVAKASGCNSVVFSTGRTSEEVAQRFFNNLTAAGTGGVKEECFILMGDFVAHALRSAVSRDAGRIIVAGQFAKMVKIATGHEVTHAAAADLELKELAAWCTDEPGGERLLPHLAGANTARDVLQRSDNDPLLMELVCRRVQGVVEKFASGRRVEVLLAGYQGEVLYFA
jgi:cobalt-precorrin-5B (C1)-methyltransferase